MCLLESLGFMFDGSFPIVILLSGIADVEMAQSGGKNDTGNEPNASYSDADLTDDETQPVDSQWFTKGKIFGSSLDGFLNSINYIVTVSMWVRDLIIKNDDLKVNRLQSKSRFSISNLYCLKKPKILSFFF